MGRLKHISLLAFITLFVSMSTWGQCVMCKALGEQSANQGMMGTGLNQGIIFIMIIPYLLIGIGLLLVWKRFNKEGE
jgi:hypothetical protein